MRHLPFFALWLVFVSFFLAWADPSNIATSLVFFIFILLFTLADPFRHAGWAAATIANLAFAYIQVSQKGGSSLTISLVLIVEALFYLTVWFGNSTRDHLSLSINGRDGNEPRTEDNPPATLNESSPPADLQSSFSFPVLTPEETVIAFNGLDQTKIQKIKEALGTLLKTETVRLFFYSNGITAYAMITDDTSLVDQLVLLKDLSVKSISVNNNWVDVNLV